MLELGAEQVAGRGARDEGHHAGRGSMRAVGRAKGVVHVDVGEGSELLGEGRVVLLLLRVEAQVLEQQDLAVAELRDGRLRLRADRGLAERHRTCERLGQALRYRAKGELRLPLPLRPPEVRAERHPRPAGKQPPQAAERCLDPRVVGHAPVPQRHVQVGTDQHPPATQPPIGQQIIKRRNGHARNFVRLRLTARSACGDA
jgi:hypothetical protein